MSDGTPNMLAAFVAALKAGLGAAAAVYTRAPQDTAGTYVLVSLSAVPSDTKTYSRKEHLIDIDIYCDYRGLKEVTDVGKLIYDALQRTAITVTGYSSSPPQFQSERYFETPDGSRGVLGFSMITRAE